MTRFLPFKIYQGLLNDFTPRRRPLTNLTQDLAIRRENWKSAGSSGSVFTNLGATGTVTATLPSNAREGDFYTFQVGAAHELRINPPASHQLVVGGAVQSAGLYVSADDEGEWAEVTYLGSKKWFVAVGHGTWTVETP